MAFITIYERRTKDRHGHTIYSFNTNTTPNNNFANGSWIEEGTPEQSREKAIQGAMQYLGINRWDIVGEEGTAPAGVDINENYNKSVASANLEIANRQRQEALKAGYKGRFSDEALQDIITDPGSYLPSYISKLPQNEAEELIKVGKIGGWQVNDRFFRTQQEANAFINQNAKTTPTQQAPQWMPELYPSLKAAQDLKKRFESTYEPYVTIEGTTLYIPKGRQPSSVTVPRFGKMIPAKEDPATKFISENFEKGERFVSDTLMLHEILNPVIKSVESYKPRKYEPTFSSFTGQEYKDFTLGALTNIRDKPLTAAGNVALAILVTKGLGVLPKVAGITAGIGKGVVASKVSAVNILGVGLAGMYGYDVHRRITTSSSPARTAGGIAATELIPFGVGGYIGAKKLPSLQKIQLRNSVSARKILSSDSMTGKLWKEPTPEYIQAQSKAHNILNPSTGRHPVGIKSITGYKDPTTIKGEWWKEHTPEYTQARYKAMDILQRGDLKALSEHVKEPFQLVKPKIIKSVETITYPKLPKQLGEVKFIGEVTYKKDLTSIIKARQQARMAEYESLMKSGNYIVTNQGQILLTKQKTIQKTKTIQEEKAISKTEVKQTAKTVQTTKTKLKTIFPMVAINAYATTANRNISQVKSIFKQIQAQTTQQQTRTQQATRQVPVQISRQITATKAIAAQRAKQTAKQVTAQRAKQVTAQKTKMRVPERPVKLGIPKFASEISRIAKKRKNRGKYIWDVNNPVPTLEQVLG